MGRRKRGLRKDASSHIEPGGVLDKKDLRRQAGGTNICEGGAGARTLTHAQMLAIGSADPPCFALISGFGVTKLEPPM